MKALVVPCTAILFCILVLIGSALASPGYQCDGPQQGCNSYTCLGSSGICTLNGQNTPYAGAAQWGYGFYVCSEGNNPSCPEQQVPMCDFDYYATYDVATQTCSNLIAGCAPTVNNIYSCNIP